MRKVLCLKEDLRDVGYIVIAGDGDCISRAPCVE